jgi:hypothetical protein
MAAPLCPEEESLGVLVLGALDPTERDHVETHARECLTCAAMLSELAPLPGLLHRIDLPTLEDPPAYLLERAIAQARAEESVPVSRRRWRGAALVVAVAAAVLVLMMSMLVTNQPNSFTVSATSPVTDVEATIRILPTDSGTELDLTLEGVDAGEHCQLVVVGRDGEREVASTWIANYEGEAAVIGNTSIMRADLRHLEVTTLDGRTLVTVDVPA